MANVVEVLTESLQPRPEIFEVIHGRIVELPDKSAYAETIANRLPGLLNHYLIQHGIGVSAIGHRFNIRQPDDPGRIRRPDWSFVSFQRWPKDRPCSYRAYARDVVPDIVAEIVSPGDFADELIAKVREYLRGGVRLAWIVYPLGQEIHAYVPGSKDVRVYYANDELDAGEVLPGFRTPVAPLFPPVELPPITPPAE